MLRRGLLLYCLVLLFSVTTVSFVRADNSVASSYLHMRNMLGSTPGTAADLSNDQNATPQAARYYEFQGRIVGKVTSDDQPVVLIQVGSLSTEVSVSQSFLDRTDWMATGNVIRALVKSVPNSTGGPEQLVLISAGPEYSISTLEKKLAVAEEKAKLTAQSRISQRAAMETSRGGMYPPRFVCSPETGAGINDRIARIFPAYENMIARLNPKLSDNDVYKITKSILVYADDYQLDPRLIVAMVIAESDFDPYSVSRTGAVGLGQLMPETANELGVLTLLTLNKTLQLLYIS